MPEGIRGSPHTPKEEEEKKKELLRMRSLVMQMLSEPLDSEMDVRRHASGPPDGTPTGHSRCKINNVS
jgi:hypothetical protein